MHHTENIEYFIAQCYFEEAEIKNQKLYLGNFDTNIWLHKEKINLDLVIETAKHFSDSRIFIISEGINKGFYIYSQKEKICFKLINTNHPIQQAQAV